MSYGGREAAEAASSEAVKIGDQVADGMWARVAEWRRDPVRLLFAPDGTLSRGLVLSVAALFALPTVDYFWKYEGGAANQFFVFSITLTLAACLVLAFCRVLVASVLVNALVGIVAIIAWAKHQAMDMALHAYDLVFYLSSWSTISFLWRDFRPHVIALIAALSATVIAAAVAYRFDTNRVRRRTALVAVTLLTIVSTGAAFVKGERRHTQYYWNGLHISSFYSSWAETIETLWRGQLIEAAGSAPGVPFTVPAECPTTTKPPHIILIHEESIVPPGHFPTLQYDHGVDRLFASHDGKEHRLRVETYGGASWLTEFSVLTGLSTHSFGGMSQFVQPLMAGKLRDTLPETLARCGYRNVVFYPLMRNFVSNAKFYASIGLKEVFDAEDQGAKTDNERDRFYFGNALDEMTRHLQKSRQPLFTMIFTMATHSPYDITYMPEVDVPGGGPGTDPEMNEYLRRLAMARIDYDELRHEITRRFPGERFLIVQYGDHHPIATRTLLGLDNKLEAEDISLPLESPGFVTYYAIDGINYQPPALPAVETLDVPYMPLVILNAARLPLSDAFRERQRMLAACHGRYFTCEPRDTVLAFHRRLIDSGLIEAH
jgi:phosphoglycerol transferase MdoB-like AlkP superfamily enzyme